MKQTFAGHLRKFVCSAALAAVTFFCFAGPVFAVGPLEGEALVLLKSGEGGARSAAGAIGARVIKTFDALSEEAGEVFVHMKSETLSTEALIAKLAENPNVVCASPNYPRRATRAPNDPHYSSGKQWGPKRIGAESAWNTSTGKQDVYVAIIDSGIQRNHPDLQANLDATNSRNFTSSSGGDSNYDDANGHGSHVAGIIGAVGNNGAGIAGLNWNVKLAALRILNDQGYGTTSMELAAINHLVGILRANPNMNLPVVNLSLGGWEPTTPQAALNTTLFQAYRTLDRMNRAVIVVAAGNEGAEVGAPAPFDLYDTNNSLAAYRGYYCYPASYIGLNNMIVVASIEQGDSGSYFTNWSSRYVHLAAPGGSILSTVTGSEYALISGTSMATPHVSGAVALLASVHPEWTASELKSHILLSAQSSVNPKALAINRGRTLTPQMVSDTRLSSNGLIDLTDLLTTDKRDIRVTSVTLSGSTSMTAGSSQLLGLQILPEDATNKSVSWTSSNESVATVDTNGRVTALSDGSTVILAIAGDNSGISGSIAITVGSKKPSDETGGGGGGCAAGAAGILATLALAAIGGKQTRRES